MKYVLENEKLKLVVDSLGCEIKSVMEKETNREFMWNGNPDAWKRTAPVLFPIVGKYRDNESLYEGKTYTMSQHGFARDNEFDLVENNGHKLVMKLLSNDSFKEKYPFDFALYIEYELNDNRIKKTLKVVNTDNKEIYFSIGGHPAFVCPELNESQAGVKICFEEMRQDNKDSHKISYKLLSEDGLVVNKEYDLELDSNYEFRVDKTFFDKDALIVENGQAKKVSLAYNGKKYVTVKFDAPVFGLWSAAKKDVPFICIEPWYGRADAVDFNKDLTKREWSNKLSVNEEFVRSYEVEFL